MQSITVACPRSGLGYRLPRARPYSNPAGPDCWRQFGSNLDQTAARVLWSKEPITLASGFDRVAMEARSRTCLDLNQLVHRQFLKLLPLIVRHREPEHGIG
jgi:hypothetical protein